MSEEKKNQTMPVYILGIIVFIFIIILVLGSGDNQSISGQNPDGQFDCGNYQEELHKIADSPEDLIETHRATGVIQQIDENEKYYVVVINPSIWKDTTAEQRQLIRCSITEVAQSKGKEGGIIDPIKKERLY